MLTWPRAGAYGASLDRAHHARQAVGESMAEIAFIASLTAQCTLVKPARSLMNLLERTECV